MTTFVPVFRVVPNGVAVVDDNAHGSDGNASFIKGNAPTNGQAATSVRLRVTLLATPYFVKGKGEIELTNWPHAIAQWFRERKFKIDLFIEPATMGLVVPACTGVGKIVGADLYLLRKANENARAPDQFKKIDKLWQSTIDDAGGFSYLENALKHSAENAAFKADMSQAIPEGDALKANISAAVDRQGALIGKQSGQGTTEAVTSVLTISHADLAAHLQVTRGERACNSVCLVDPPVVRGITTDDAKRIEDARNKQRDHPASENDEMKLLKDMREKRLVEAVKKTSGDRKRAKKIYDDILGDLRSNKCIDFDPNSEKAVNTQNEISAAQASPQTHVQEYGTFPQQGAGDSSTADDAVSQAFYALQSSPTLARIFGFAFDAEIVLDAADIGGIPKDGIAYAFIGPDADLCNKSRAATAVRIQFCDGKPKNFLPATRAELMLSPSCSPENRKLWLDGRDQRDGLVPMSAPFGNAKRFELSSLDVRRAVDQALEADTENNGEALRTAQDNGQRYSTMGFSFNDRRRGLAVLEELAVLTHHQEVDNLGTLYAEDLTVGHVIDVRVEWPREKPSQWRCLMERHVEFEPLEKLDAIVPVLVGAAKSQRRMDLERGLIAATTRVMPNPALASTGGAASGKTPQKYVDLIVEEAVATWTGAPMAVDTGALGDRLPQETLLAEAQAAVPQPVITRVLSLPGARGEGHGRRPPPLRYGVPYRFGMRCVYAGGGGLSVDEAQTLYEDTDSAFMLPGTGPQPFSRNESILRPDILMLTEDARREYGIMGFEDSLTVVLRGSNGTLEPEKMFFARDVPESTTYPLNHRLTPKHATRIIMPPAVGMEDAARHGMFDGRGGWDNWRYGAMRKLWYKGGYPKCIDRTEIGWNEENIVVTRSKPTFDTGHGVATFRLQAPPLKPETNERFFPDPAARFLVIRLLRNGEQLYLEEKALIPFYARGDKGKTLSAADYNSITPIKLNFETSTSLKNPKIEAARAILLRDERQSIQVTNVTIKLAPSDDLHVHMWCVPDIETLKDQFALIEYMTRCGGRDAAGTLWCHLTERSPVQELAAVESITATYAVNRPGDAPVITLRPGDVDRLPPPVTPPVPAPIASLPVTTNLPTAAAPEQNVQPPDYSGFLLDGTLRLDAKSTDTFELYMTCSSPSDEMDNVALERSLSKRRAGTWPTYPHPITGVESYQKARQIFGFDIATTGRVTLPASTVQLVRCDRLPPPTGENDSITLELSDLLKAGFAQEPGQSAPVPPVDQRFGRVTHPYVFQDEKARRLVIRCVAIGRHATKFQTRSTFGTDNGRRHLRRSIPLNPSEQCTVSEVEQVVWLNSAMRPPAPILSGCEPSFSLTRSPADNARTVVTCKSNVRIRMPRPWFMSGEGEMLAIVVAPEENKLIAPPVDDQATVTKWGSDPIWRGMPGEAHLRGFQNFELQRCRHRHKTISSYQLPLGPKDDPKKKTAPVGLLVFEPHFDVDRQEWYVDVPLSESLTATPFVHLVLVRYQEHTSSQYVKTSEPVKTQAQLMPKREVEACCIERNGDWHASFVMRGLSNQGPYVPKDLSSPEMIRPRLSLRLFHERTDRDGRLHRVDVISDDAARQAMEQGRPWSAISSGQMEWKLETKISKARREALGEGRYVAFLSETQRFMPATYADEFPEPVSWSDMNRAETLVTSGSRFSVRIDLRVP